MIAILDQIIIDVISVIIIFYLQKVFLFSYLQKKVFLHSTRFFYLPLPLFSWVIVSTVLEIFSSRVRVFQVLMNILLIMVLYLTIYNFKKAFFLRKYFSLIIYHMNQSRFKELLPLHITFSNLLHIQTPTPSTTVVFVPREKKQESLILLREVALQAGFMKMEKKQKIITFVCLFIFVVFFVFPDVFLFPLVVTLPFLLTTNGTESGLPLIIEAQKKMVFEEVIVFLIATLAAVISEFFESSKKVTIRKIHEKA